LANGSGLRSLLSFSQYQKRHAKKKQKAEVLFRARMKALREELADFNAMNYVKDVIKR